MKGLVITILLVIPLFGLLQASDSVTTKETTRGKMVEVSLVNEGRINLFSHESEMIPATIPQDPLESYMKKCITYYVSKGQDKLIEVHCANYKNVLRDVLADNEELAGKIGQKGFRYADIESIISQYNGN